jgi:tRNA (cmo5U34)-methyltransferase
VTEGWTPDTYLDEIRAEIPQYDEFQNYAVEATRGIHVRDALELGVGTGETAKRLLAVHPSARLVGIDGSEEMLAAARDALPDDRVELKLGRLEDPLPPLTAGGRFDLVVSVLAVHHLAGEGKAALFERVAAALTDHGRFVLADVVVPAQPEDVVVPIEEGFDFPDPLPEQLAWLSEAGFFPTVVWSWQDLAVVRADLQTPV